MTSHPNRGKDLNRPGRSPSPEEVLAARTDSGLTQTEAAALIYSTLSAWQRWEYGERQMHPAHWEYWRLKVKARK